MTAHKEYNTIKYLLFVYVLSSLSMMNALTAAHKYPLYKNDFVIIDIKTSGLRLSKDKIVALSLAHIKNGKLEEERHIKPTEKNFQKIANQLQVFLSDKIIVAQNASLTYSFLRHEMLRYGLDINSETICSIRLSRLLFSEAKNHDLKAISKRLSFDIKGKSQFELLVNFFSQLNIFLTPQDFNKTINLLLENENQIRSLNYKGRLPDTGGIFRCYDKNGILIYVGKSESLVRSVESIFQGNTIASKEVKIARQIAQIDWVKTQGEFGTSLLASQIINMQKPIFNNLMKKKRLLYTIQIAYNENYLILKSVNISTLTPAQFCETIGIFKSEKDADTLIKFFINQSVLCHEVNFSEKIKSTCFRYKVNACYGACNKQELSEEYNSRVKKVIATFAKNAWPFKGKIAIQETCHKTDSTVFHAIHNWHYINTKNSITQLNGPSDIASKMDTDIYLLVKKFISKKTNNSKIVEIE